MNYEFDDSLLLETALTHTSWAYENGGEHNERMEFLGDAVLQLCSTEMLYAHYPDDREGVLHRFRTQMVSTGHLASVARRWGLDKKAKLGKGEEATGGRDKDRLLAGIFEAVLGAIYLDGGYDSARAVVEEAIGPDFDRLRDTRDARVVLHEHVQSDTGSPPQYVVVDETGPAHERLFTIEARIEQRTVGEGTGRSKKAATIAAAESALKRMGLVT